MAESRNIAVPMKQYMLLLALFLMASAVTAQVIPDSARRIELEPQRQPITVSERILEDAPLDHRHDRGFTIVGHQRDLQLQIQASVRDLAVLDGFALHERSRFTTWDIPTGNRHAFDPSFHNDLSQTRIGLIGTRSTEDGAIVLRFEADFAGADGFRIRHAYGEYENVIVGQTWSIFSHVTLQPLTIDLSGPLGVGKNLTPQVRYRWTGIYDRADLTIGLEFPGHTYRPTIDAAPVDHQLLPDPSVRLAQRFDWGEIQTSLIVPFLSGRYGTSSNLAVSVGWGLSASALIRATTEGTVRLHASAGQGIADLFATFAGRGYNVQVNQLDEPDLTFVIGGYASYEHRWQAGLRSTLTCSAVSLGGNGWGGTVDDLYQWGWATAANTFWNIYDGLHAGAEVTVGSRIDTTAQWGTVLRVAGLVYYEL